MVLGFDPNVDARPLMGREVDRALSIARHGARLPVHSAADGAETAAGRARVSPVMLGPDANVGAKLRISLEGWDPPSLVASAPTGDARTRREPLEAFADDAEPVGLHPAAGILRIRGSRVVVQPGEDAD